MVDGRQRQLKSEPRIRPGVGLHDEGDQLPPGARGVLRRGRPGDGEAQQEWVARCLVPTGCLHPSSDK